MDSQICAVVELPAKLPALKGRTKLGEGAVWCPITQRLLWIDIVKGKLFSYDYEGSKENRCADVRQPVGTVVPHTADTVVAALTRGICVVDAKTGRIVRSLGNPEAELAENRWNDGKCDPAGRLWVGSMNSFCDQPVGALWCLDGEGKWTKAVSDITVSNGLVWSSDQRTFWYIDTPTHRVDAFDFDAAAGTLSNRRSAIVIDAKDGFPDGCCLDADDNLWVAMWAGGAVRQYNPRTSELLRVVEIPGASQVTSCAFGGKDLNQLFVTTCSAGKSEEELRSPAEENSGAVFRVDLSALGIRGSAGHAYRG